jgi:ubiquinone/menaquinone biosynthesis C-methylase UbiE
VAQWYHETVEDKGSYQRDLILPNVIRLLDIKKGETVLDLACGEGFFARRYANNGASVVGVDVASELIDIARKSGAVSSQAPLGNTRDKQSDGKVKEENPKYYVAGADAIPFVADNSIDKITIILALQNIENVTGVFKECSRVLKTGGKLLLVINHPAFRVPKASGWGWASSANSKEKTAKSGEEAVQYRRIDKYMSELREKIDMAPGTAASEHTISFHRPLQYFVKLLGKVGLAVINMEEWVGNRKSQPGPRAGAEDKARAEIPLFMMLEVKKI